MTPLKITITALSFLLLGPLSGHSKVIADLAGDWTDPGKLPAGWGCFYSDLPVGGDEIALTPGLPIGNEGNLGFGSPGGLHLPGMIGRVTGKKAFQIFGDGYFNQPVAGKDLILHPSDDPKRRNLILRYEISPEKITTLGKLATISGSFRNLVKGGDSVSVSIYHNSKKVFSTHGNETKKLSQANGGFYIRDISVAGGDRISFLVDSQETLGGDETALEGTIALTQETTREKLIEFKDLLEEIGNRDSLARWTDVPWKNLQTSAIKTVDRKQPGFIGGKAIGNFVRIEEKPDGTKEWVLMEHMGPGVIVRMWSPNMAKDALFRVYLDGNPKPVIELNMMKFFYGEDFVKPPFAELIARGGNIYLPIPFAKSCKITVDKNVCGWAQPDDLFYVIQYRAYEPKTKIKTFEIQDYTANPDRVTDCGLRLRNKGSLLTGEVLGNPSIDPQKSWEIDLKPGAQALNFLSIQVESADLTLALRSTVLKMSFDGKETISSPVGDFFGSGYGLNPFRDWMRSVTNSGELSCQWVMPYEKSAKLVLENTGRNPIKVKLSVGYQPWKWDDQSMYFHSNWAMDRGIDNFPTSNFNYISIQGAGVYVGDTLSITSFSEKWWGEGPEKILVDHESFPSHFGTGTEDYYGYAWGDRHFYDSPFVSQPRLPEGPGFYGTTVNTRIRSLDAIPFRSALHFDMEVLPQTAFSGEFSEMDFAVTTYWYGFKNSFGKWRRWGESNKSIKLEGPAPEAL
jgi:hypothetical protein